MKRSLLLLFSSILFILALAASASAQTCSTDADCPADTFTFAPWCDNTTTLVGITQTFECSFNFCSFDFVTEVREHCANGCEAGACLGEPVCGNDVVEGSEECDDGNNNNNDGCSAECTIEPSEFTCSSDADCPETEILFDSWCSVNNVMNVHKVYTCENPATVRSFCAFSVEEFIVEECTTTCRRGACQNVVLPVCGNDVVERGEACDDGNNVSNDGCSSTCTIETITCSSNADCGTDREELFCSGNNVSTNMTIHTCNNPGTFRSSCSVKEGVVLNETCPFICSEGACVAEPVCGNGIVDTTVEQCDDGNTDNGDGCSDECEFEVGEPVCGNNIREDGEECDGGNSTTDNCSSTCTLFELNVVCNTDADCPADAFDTRLGQWCQDDGVWGVFQNFSCENPGQPFNFCAWSYQNQIKESCEDCQNAQCPLVPVCGNSLVEDGETCDDGNQVSGDGCSDVCLIEIDPPVGNETNSTFVSLFELGVLQLAAHDLFNVNRGTGVDSENGKLDLSTLFDHGDTAILQGGEGRNSANLIVHSVAVLYGKLFFDLTLIDGFSEEEAKQAVLNLYLSDVADAYENVFNQDFPDVPLLGATTHTENLAYRTLHEILPGEIELNGTTVGLFDANIQSVILTFDDLQQQGGVIDGQFDPALLNITIFVPPSTFITVDLLEADRSFGEQFGTDITFDEFLSELEDGRYDENDQVFRLIRRLFRKSLI